MRLVVIDTGLDQNMIRELERFRSVDGITIRKEENKFVYLNEFNDRVGHGTTVCSILNSYLSQQIDLFIINIFENDIQCDMSLLLEALKYCLLKIECDAIQISLGTLYTKQALMDIVDDLAANGTLVISAFDNENSLSYPAAYPSVLGIDITSKYHKIKDYDIVENNVIDIRGANTFFRVKSLAGLNYIVSGSSFYCSYILALIINDNDGNFQKKNVLNRLKLHANTVYKINDSQFKMAKKIRRAIVFPMNKEIYSIAAFEHLIPFEIVGYYDIRQSGKVNKVIKTLLGYSNNSKVVRSIHEVDWTDDFDTVICGHVGEIGLLLGSNVLEEISSKCLMYNKFLWCFDNAHYITQKYPELNIWSPNVSRDIIPQYRFGKLRSPGIPIVGIFGTSSKQGKMTLQLKLREAFIERNIKVKNIGSEPEAPLFGFEFTYTFGYGATDLLTPQEMILTINEAVYELEKQDCEIIIAGSQSGTIAYQYKNLDMIPLKQYYFLLAVQPDSIVLCINGYDSIEYVQRTICFFEATVKAKVICLCVSYINNKKFRLAMNSIDYYKQYLNLPIFDLMNFSISNMVQIIQNYYAGGE